MGSKDIKQWPVCDDFMNSTEFMSSQGPQGNGTGVPKECHIYDTYQYETCNNLLASAENNLLCKPDTPNNYTQTACNAYEACKSESGYFGMLLSFLTLFLCFLFQSFRNSSIFTTQVRKQLANFGVVMSIGICVLVDQYMGLPTFKLKVPTEFTTTVGRSWFLDFTFNAKCRVLV